MDLTAKELIELTKEIDKRCIDFAKWLIKEETEELMFDRMQDDLENTYENMLEIFKKEKGL
jgi:hypothetical protein